MKIDVQRAGLDDVRDIAILTGEYRAEMMSMAGHSGLSGSESGFLEDLFREFLDNDDYAVLVARSVRGHPLGYMTLFESQPYFDDPYGVLEQVFVRPFYRRRRIARRLVSEARKLAEDKRWRRILVTMPVSLRLEEAMLFFESQGFTNAGKRKQWLLI